MDEKKLFNRNLADIFNSEIFHINQILTQHPEPVITIKADQSPVTELDLALSSFVEEVVKQHFPQHNFYSEENFKEWTFPLVALDPLDGTREYIQGRGEWAISLGVFADVKFKGEGWIYNPVTKEVFDRGLAESTGKKEKYWGEVSHSEWEKGLFKNHQSAKFALKPMGSIAYKLGRLSQNKCDFVVSLRPKNIWDIAGGTLLCQQSGKKFYAQGKEVTKVEKLYSPPLIWCEPWLLPELLALFPS